MASLLRQLVAGPRARHPEAGLDLCYVTDKIIATSGPSGTYPQRAYRNPLDVLVKFLDDKHKEDWAIWEFRAEGTGYPDSEVYGRIWHYPWPDHHPPPFALVPNIMASMRNWLQENDNRVVVVHCKAGKGRSGTMSCSYLVSEEGWAVEDAIKRFTERRMRPGFGAGVSIPSQLRTLTYVNRWTKNGKIYVERQVEILEVRVFGLKDGVKVSIEGFVDGGKLIKKFHAFEDKEIEIARGKIPQGAGFVGIVAEVLGRGGSSQKAKANEKGPAQTTVMPLSTDEVIDKHIKEGDSSGTPQRNSQSSVPATQDKTVDSQGADGCDAILRPSKRIILPSSDINVDFERRNTAAYNLSMVTSVSHVWFNVFFEGNGPEQQGRADRAGVFRLDWDKLDGVKGSSRKGTRAFDYFELQWKIYEEGTETVIHEPKVGEQVAQATPADWRGNSFADEANQKDLGLRTQSPTASEENATLDSQLQAQKVATMSDAHGTKHDPLETVKSHVETNSPGEETGSDHPPTEQIKLSTTQDSAQMSTQTPVRSTKSGEVSASSTAAPSRKSSVKDRIKSKLLGRKKAGEDHEQAALAENASDPVDAIRAENTQGKTVEIIAGSTTDGTTEVQTYVGTADLPGGRPESEMKTVKEHTLGHLSRK